MKRVALIGLLVVIFLVNFAGSQVGKNGKVKGLVVDPNDAVILGSKITITGKGRKWILKPDTDGHFETELPAGVYEIKIEASGFRSFNQKKVQVKSNSEIERKFKLEVLPTTPVKCPPGSPCL